MLFPDPRINRGSNRVIRHSEYAVPAVGWFVLDAIPGTEELLVMLAPKRLDGINFPPGAAVPVAQWQQVVVPYFLKHQKAHVRVSATNPEGFRSFSLTKDTSGTMV